MLPTRFFMNLLITLTTCAMFGIVQIIAYIRLTIVDAYSIQDIFIFPVSLLGLILTIDRKSGQNFAYNFVYSSIKILVSNY